MKVHKINKIYMLNNSLNSNNKNKINNSNKTINYIKVIKMIVIKFKKKKKMFNKVIFIKINNNKNELLNLSNICN